MLAVVIVATSVFGLEVRMSYGPGINSALGSQLTRDFLADQDAEAAALSTSDQTQLNNRLSDSALVDVIQQIQGQAGGSPPTVSFQPSSITVLRAQDPNNPSLLIEVQEDGVKTVTRNSGPNSAPTQDQIGFHADFWLRLSGGRYLIADQNIQTQPTSYLPQVGLAVVALVWVGLAYVLFRRTRPTIAPVAAPPTPLVPSAAEAPIAFDVGEVPEPPAKTVIRTFGGLQVIEAGRDWAPELSRRQVMTFVWRRVFLASLLDQSATVAREVVARQLYPAVDRETQLKRIRGLVNDLRELPDPLRKRILSGPQVLRFDLQDCTVDALELIQLSTGLARVKVLSPAQASRARGVVDATSGTFMPEFETIDDLVTDHHPTCTDMVQDLRRKLSDRRAEVMAVLAATYIAGRRPDLAVEMLEPALHTLPDRADLRELLAGAYRASGREVDARALVGV